MERGRGIDRRERTSADGWKVAVMKNERKVMTTMEGVDDGRRGEVLMEAD